MSAPFYILGMGWALPQTKIDNADGGGNFDGGYNAAGPTGGNTLDCREYHLGAALVDHTAAHQQLHCNHVGMTSVTCM